MAFVALVVFIGWWCWDSHERRIRANLKLVTEVASKTDGEHKLAFVGKVRSLQELFHLDFTIKKSDKNPEIKGREKVKGLFINAWRTYSNWQVLFDDITVKVSEDEKTAQSTQTIRITHETKEGKELLTPREIKLYWQLNDDKWLLYSAEVVQVFR